MVNTQSYWLESTPSTDYPPLTQDISTEVAVLGGGLVGISTAWQLKQAGMKVVLIEADRICQGVSGHTTAKITSLHSLTYATLLKDFGLELAQQYADANETAIKTMKNMVQSMGIACDFQEKSAYVYTCVDNFIAQIEDEAKAVAQLGLPGALDQEPGLPFAVKAAIRFDGQGQFHPRKFALALANAIPGAGCEIYENTPVTGVEEGPTKVISTGRGPKVRAQKVVLATHFPIHDGGGLYFTRMYAERSYILGVRTQSPLPAGMYITAEQPGRSLRTVPTPEGEMLLVGGEHHRTGVGKEWRHYQLLEEFSRANFTVSSIPYRWSAQDYTTADGIPYIGFLKKGKQDILVATGFKKWGVTTSVAAALILGDLLVKGSSPWQDVFSPLRGASLKSVGSLAKMNVEVAKELVSGKIAPSSQRELAPGEAKVLSKKGSKIGLYLDDEGLLHKVDLTCTHLGCELQWNSAEKTWDCPCHGSRFSPDGAIVSGPALKPLNPPSEGKNDPDPDLK